LRDEFGLTIDIEADFRPVGVWEALRRRPDLLFIFADRLTSQVRDAISMIPRLTKCTRVLVVTGIDDPPLLQAWGQCQFDGFILKSGGLAELRHAYRAITAGQSYVS